MKNAPSGNMQHKMESKKAEIDVGMYTDPKTTFARIKRLTSLINAAQARNSEGTKDKSSVEYFIHTNADNVEDAPIKQIIF